MENKNSKMFEIYQSNKKDLEECKKQISLEFEHCGFYLWNLQEIDFEKWINNFESFKFEILSFLINMYKWQKNYIIHLRGHKK